MNKIIDNVNRATQGDQEAISELYYETYPKIRAVAVSILKNENDADDIVQDSYIKAFANLHQLDDAKKFEAWLCRIVSNKCKDYLKKKKPILFSEQTTEIDSEPIEWTIKDDSKEFNPEEVVISEDTRNQLMELLDSLPDEQRICLLYFAVYEMKISEIADLLEVSENTVKSRLRYAERKMRDKIEELEKKGIKIRSFTGFALLPFLQHLFATDAKAAPYINPSMIFEGVKGASKNIASESISSAISDVGVQTAKTVAGNVVKSLGIKEALSGVAGKIVAGVLAVSVAIGGVGVYKHIQNNGNEASSYISEAGTKINLNELSNQELAELNEYLTFFSEQNFEQYPCSDDELYDFAYIYNKINTNNVYVSNTDRFEYAYSIEKNKLDETLQMFFGKSVVPEGNEYRVLENYVYYQPAADGEQYNGFSIATALYASKNKYTVGFDTYEIQHEYYHETNSEITKRQFVGSGYMVLEKLPDGEYKIINYIGNNFPETEAYKLYEELLSKGKTENGLDITHYAYVNLNNDNIIELLVANSDGSPDKMFESELFTIKDNKIHSCGRIGSYYDYVYLINDGEYIRGCSRMGNNYVSTEKNIDLVGRYVAAFEGDTEPKFMSTISYNGETKENITKEEFEYYTIMPDDGSNSDRFIKSAEPIAFNKNKFIESKALEDYSVYNGRYSGGGVIDPNDNSIVIGQWHATISNATESSMNLAFVQSESDCYIEDMILYRQENGEYSGVGKTLYGKANITIQIKSPECIALSATGFVNQMGMEHLYKK